MPRAARKKKDAIDPDSIWICWMSGSAEVDGQTVSFHEGQRVRGDSAAVQACPMYFVPDGTRRASGRPRGRRSPSGQRLTGRLCPSMTCRWCWSPSRLSARTCGR
jgi:hypothetical protein